MKKTSTNAFIPVKIHLVLLFLVGFFFGSGTLTAQDCLTETDPPICTPPPNMTLLCTDLPDDFQPGDISQYESLFGPLAATDDCPVTFELLNPIIEFEECSTTIIKRRYKAIDQAGNVSTVCQQTIQIEPAYAYTINLPKDVRPGDTEDPELVTLTHGSCDILTIDIDNQVVDYNCDNGPDKTVRIYQVVNWCEYDGISPVAELPRLDLDNDSREGDAYAIFVEDGNFYAQYPGQAPLLLGPSKGYYQYTQIIDPIGLEESAITFSGHVFVDANENCIADDMEQGLAGYTVVVTGLVSGTSHSVMVEEDGFFSTVVCPSDTLFEVSMDLPYNYGGNCQTSYIIEVTPENPEPFLEFPVQLNADCPLLNVDIVAPLLRRCFSSSYYINYCNLSADTVEDASIEVALDSFLVYNTSTAPGVVWNLGNNVYQFELGDLPPGECSNFTVTVQVSCDAWLGKTHCTSARIFPDTICAPTNPLWSGASIEVNATCETDSLNLLITNTGTGAMNSTLNYIVVEDVLLMKTGTFNLEPDETEIIKVPANGATWHLEAEQEPGHPGLNMPSLTVEGCGGINTTGIPLLFGDNDADPFISIDCQENIGSYDPNDKQAFPHGYGEPNYIRPNTDLEYLIRFQNTGTDIAFNVVIVDTLSNLLNARSLRPGVSSHDYRFDLDMLPNNQGAVATFTFENIMLPDSNANEPASHGFIKFDILQKPDNALGAVIENNAAIYFDFNEPVITNTVFHTLGEDFLEVLTSTQEFEDAGAQLVAFPNPITSESVIHVKGTTLDQGVFELIDLTGQTVLQKSFSGNQTTLSRRDLSSGLYLFRIRDQSGIIGTGKLMIK